MLIIPAIDIKDGRCVRLVQGDMSRATVYADDPRVIATTTDYGTTFVSSVWLANVFACQFHPEKSQAAGLRILANFAALTGEAETRAGAAG